MALTLVGESQDPFVVLGAPDGTRLQAARISAGITADLGWNVAAGNASADAGVAADLTGAELVIDAAESDSFLRTVLPADGLRTRFDAGLDWSQRRGLTFRGSAGLDTTLPTHVSLGPLGAVDALYLRLGAAGGGLQGEVSCVATVRLGPARLTIDRVGVVVALTTPEVGGNLGLANVDVGFVGPRGMGMTLTRGS